MTHDINNNNNKNSDSIKTTYKTDPKNCKLLLGKIFETRGLIVYRGLNNLY